MNKMLKILVMPLGALPLVCATLSLIGCSKTPEKLVYKKGDCVRVFMHEPGRYSVFDKDLKVVSFRNMRWCSDGNTSQLVADVPKGKDMWYEGEYVEERGHHQGWKWVKIHIHDLNDINGGAWDTGGKHSHNVQTRPIE